MKNPNGYGTVYKLSGNRRRPYVAQVTAGYEVSDGRCIQKRMNIGYYGTRKEAMMALASYSGVPKDEKAIYTVRDVVEMWKPLAYSKVKESSQKMYNSAINNLDGIMDTKLTEFTKPLLQNYIIRKKLSPSAVERIKVVLIGSLNLAKDNQFTSADFDFVHRIESFEKEKKLTRTIIDRSDIKKMWKDYEWNTLDAYTLCLLHTGLRISEFLSLTMDDYKDSYIVVKEAKTDAGIREVPLCSQICPVFDFLIKSGEFPACKKKSQIRAKYKEVHEYLDKMGYLPHNTRHTFVTRSLELGIPERIVKSVVGHKAGDITSVYNHIFIDRKITAYKDFGY